jgi:SAM-dependent methyltransferase
MLNVKSDHEYLSAHRDVWARKPVLRRIYREQFYAPLLAERAPGARTVEIGSGPGLLQEIDPSIIRTDILHSPWVHMAADAHHLPFASGGLDNVIGLDVLHHFNQPVRMLREAARVLRPGGRLIVVEPWITPFSRFIYTYLHQETCDLSAQPWREGENVFGDDKAAFDGNAAIPYLLTTRGREAVAQAVPEFVLKSVHPFSSLTYLLSFGFKDANALPESLYPLLYGLEQATRPVWAGLAALRAVIVWEKQQSFT